MNILNKINRNERYSQLYNYLDSLHNNNKGLYNVLSDGLNASLNIPTTIRFKTVSDTLEELCLQEFRKHGDVSNYINVLNIFVYFNDVDKNDYAQEIISSIGVEKGFKFLLNELEKIKTKDFHFYKDILGSQKFSIYTYEKLKGKKYKSQFEEEIISFLEDQNKKKSIERINKLNSMDFNSRYIQDVFKIVIGDINTDTFDIDFNLEYFDDNYDSISKEEKIEWLKKHNPSLVVYNLDLFGTSKKINEMLELNSLMNPAVSRIKTINDKYTQLMNKITANDKNCRMAKTIIYLSLYLIRKNGSLKKLEPIEYMNKILDRNSSWAVDTEKTLNPSFYGDSDVWKAFYGYGAYMTGDKNMYREIIDNKQVDQMDMYAQMIHKYFKDSDQSLMYDLIFEKGIIGDKSIYETLEMTKDLIKLIEEPILSSSVINDALTKLKGIVSSIINSAVCSLDLMLSDVVRKLFYVKFIPVGGQKYALYEIHNYAAFIKTILEYFEKSDSINSIEMDEFVNQVYVNLGVEGEKLKKYGYCSYDSVLNDYIGFGLYSNYLEKNINGSAYEFKNDSKVVYSILQFAIQKHIYNFGESFLSTIDYGSKIFVKKMISSLTENEIFYVMNSHGINFYNFNNNFSSFNEDELNSFNKKMNSIVYLKDHANTSTDFYLDFISKSESIIVVDKNNKDFKNVLYNKFINSSINLYFKYVTKNKKNLTKVIYDVNDVSDVDDFLLRFLPSMKELAKTLGYNEISVQSLIDMLDYFCDFITNILFRECFVKIKMFINEKVKNFTEDMFQVIDKLNSKDVIVNFDIGGTALTKKINEILAMLENVAISSSVISECFKDPSIEYVTISEDDIYSNNLENIFENIEGNVDFTKDDLDKIKDIVIKPGNSDNNITIENDKNKPSVGDSILDEIIKNEDKYKDIISPGTNNKKPDKIIYEDGEIFIEKENGAKITIVSKEDSVDKGKINISDKNDTITNGGFFEKIITTEESFDEIGKLITIRDFVKNMTNKKIVDVQSDLNSVKKEINNELDKVKPNMGIIKELIKKEIELNKELSKLNENSNNYFSGFHSSSIDYKEPERIELHDFANGKFSVDSKIDVLSELNDLTINEKIPLTNAQIAELLK